MKSNDINSEAQYRILCGEENLDVILSVKTARLKAHCHIIFSGQAGKKRILTPQFT